VIGSSFSFPYHPITTSVASNHPNTHKVPSRYRR
jgi:hypothetical protein